MVKINNFIGTNSNINVISQVGKYTVFEHTSDLSVKPVEAQTKYFMSAMNCNPKQVLIQLKGDEGIRLKPGAMQLMSGTVKATTGIKGVGDLLGKVVKSKVTQDAAIKPEYVGEGILVTEPTYKFPIIVNVGDWDGAIVCDDGMFLCCDAKLKDSISMRSNLSSAALGGEGFFNLCLRGNGLAVLQSTCPIEELYEVVLENDTFKIDGNNAVCWSESLEFTCEKSTKTLLGSAASGEGFVNTYRGTGRILMCPLS